MKQVSCCAYTFSNGQLIEYIYVCKEHKQQCTHFVSVQKGIGHTLMWVIKVEFIRLNPASGFFKKLCYCHY